ncbi:MAG: hypothetical protein HC872_06305 [Gammaproteobacteria bacterium]|nr:hypothetical protein [Gammaproteobacteria bacterium]
MQLAQTVNDLPQTSIESSVGRTPCTSNKEKLLAYVSRLIWRDLERVLPEDESCVVAAALVNDGGLRFIIGVTTHCAELQWRAAILRTLPRSIAGIPADHVVDEPPPLRQLEATPVQNCPAPENGTPCGLRAERRIVDYIRAVYGSSVRRTVGAIGISHPQSRRTPMASNGRTHHWYDHLRKYFNAAKSREQADLNVELVWYKYGQQPPRAVCSPEYLIEAGVDYERDG